MISIEKVEPYLFSVMKTNAQKKLLTQRPVPRFQMIIAAICEVYEIKPNILFNRGRHRPASEIKAMCCYVLRKHCGYTYPAIAEIFKLHHTTVMNRVDVIAQNLIDIDKRYKAKYERVLEILELN